jgi:hypothetical protein
MTDTSTFTRKTVQSVRHAPGRHWVGDGFPVHGLFGYSGEGVAERSPFLMLDYAAPTSFRPPRSGAAWAATRTAASRP